MRCLLKSDVSKDRAACHCGSFVVSRFSLWKNRLCVQSDGWPAKYWIDLVCWIVTVSEELKRWRVKRHLMIQSAETRTVWLGHSLRSSLLVSSGYRGIWDCYCLLARDRDLKVWKSGHLNGKTMWWHRREWTTFFRF